MITRKIQVCGSITQELLNDIEEIRQRENRTLSFMVAALLEQAVAERKRQREKNRKKKATSH